MHVFGITRLLGWGDHPMLTRGVVASQLEPFLPPGYLFHMPLSTPQMHLDGRDKDIPSGSNLLEHLNPPH
jgi:hypothetical protein